jgi:hypothetical protein
MSSAENVYRSNVAPFSQGNCDSNLIVNTSSAEQIVVIVVAMKVEIVCYGAGFPMHCDLYVVYCTSPVNFLAVVIPSRRDGTASPTYQRTAEPSPGGGIEDYDGRTMSAILLRSPLGTRGSLTCSKSTTRFKRLKVPPGGLVP